MRQKMPFCAHPTVYAEEIVPVQNQADIAAHAGAADRQFDELLARAEGLLHIAEVKEIRLRRHVVQSVELDCGGRSLDHLREKYWQQHKRDYAMTRTCGAYGRAASQRSPHAAQDDRPAGLGWPQVGVPGGDVADARRDQLQALEEPGDLCAGAEHGRGAGLRV